jgi:two-component system response regulator VicR
MLADDELSMQSLIKSIIEAAGYTFCYANDGVELLERYQQEAPDVIIMDVMMPRMDGFSATAELRSRGCTTPIIFLSAKGDIVDKSVGFKAGADDYLVKPFLPEELLLRINALLRRNKPVTAVAGDYVEIDGLELDARKHKVSVHGRNVDLTAKEFHILFLLASHPGEVFTQEQLVEALWGEEYLSEPFNIAVFIRHIRLKIEADPSHPHYIQTVWRMGYRFGD